MNAGDLLSELEQDIAWRAAELNALFQLLSADDTLKMVALRRAIVPVIQAHAEGFVKFALQSYLRHINSCQLKGAELKEIHLSWALKREFSRISDGSVDSEFKELGLADIKGVRGDYVRVQFLRRFDELLEGFVNLDEAQLDRFDKNLDESMLLSLLFQCGLEPGRHRVYSRRLNGLVLRRNDVAHGESTGANLDELIKWLKLVEQLFVEIRDAVYSAARNRSFLKRAGENMRALG